MWYDIDKTLSYNKLFNFVVGPRGVGKTYAAKKKVIRNFLKKGEHFVYLRRYDTEIKQKKLDNFFLDVGNEFPEYDFYSKYRSFYMNEEVFGWAMSLSQAAQYKSVPFPKVSLIIFDEFIIDQGMVRYLPNEVQSFLEMYSTIARLRDVTVMFLSNAITFTNPYFLYFDLEEPTAKSGIKVKGDLLIQYVDSPDYTEAANNTRFGKLIAGTDYSKYANENDFLRDNDKFIEDMPAGLNCRSVLKIDNDTFGVYAKGLGVWYISEKYDKTCRRIVAYSNASHDENSILKDGEGVRAIWSVLQQKYYAGELRFTSVKAKNVVAGKLINIWK